MSKGKKQQTKAILLLATSAVLVLLLAGVTFAYLHRETGAVINTFSVGNVITEIDEEKPSQNGSGLTKEPHVENIGENDCIVRVRVSVSPVELFDGGEPLQLADDKGTSLVYPFADGVGLNNWKYHEGYFYYQGVLNPNESTLPVFNKVTGVFKGDDSGQVIDAVKEAGNFQVTVYQEAVQSVVHKEDGTTINAIVDGKYDQTNANKIWEFYENGGATTDSEG